MRARKRKNVWCLCGCIAAYKEESSSSVRKASVILMIADAFDSTICSKIMVGYSSSIPFALQASAISAGHREH